MKKRVCTNTIWTMQFSVHVFVTKRGEYCTRFLIDDLSAWRFFKSSDLHSLELKKACFLHDFLPIFHFSHQFEIRAKSRDILFSMMHRCMLCFRKFAPYLWLQIGISIPTLSAKGPAASRAARVGEISPAKSFVLIPTIFSAKDTEPLVRTIDPFSVFENLHTVCGWK